MKIIERFSEATEPYYDNASPYELTVETEKGNKSFSIHEGEPEDMTFGRNLSAVFSLPSLIKYAYEAGKRGEDIEHVKEEFEY